MKFLKSCLLLSLALVSSLAVASPADSHGGRTNSEGCHTNRKTGDYHCHNGGGSSSGSGGSSSSSPSPSTGSSSGGSSSYRAPKPLTIDNLRSCSVSLKLGDRGEAVGAMQKYLARLSYIPMNAPDGVFGQDTEAAVKRYQAAKGLVTDGIVGCRTFEAMQNDLGE